MRWGKLKPAGAASGRVPHAALAKDLVAALQARGWKVAVAESMTGGLLGGAISSVSGSSAVFLGGVISYASEAKERHLGVDRDLLATQGAVSPEVARAMAAGVRERFGADLALSVTGFAEGAGAGKVHLGLATQRRVASKEMHFGGDREAIRRQAVEEALAMGLAEARAG